MSVYDSTRHTGKTKESSVNWSFPDQLSVEVLDGTKGILDGYGARLNPKNVPSVREAGPLMHDNCYQRGLH